MKLREGMTALARAIPPARNRELTLLLVILMLSAVADAASVVTLSSFLGAVAQGESDQRFWAFAAAILLASGLRFASNVLFQHYGQYAARDLMVDIQDRVLGLPFEQHFQRHSADLLAIPSKIEQLVFGLVLPVLQSVGAIITTVFVFASLFWIDDTAAIVALLLVAALYGSIAYAVRGRMHRAGQVATEAYSQRIRTTQESIGGLRDLTLDGSRAAHVAKFSAVTTRQAKAGLVSSILAALPRHAGEAIGIAAVAVLALAFDAGEHGFREALPSLGAFALAGQRLLPMAQALYQGWSAAIAGQPLLEDVAEYLALPRPDAESKGATGCPFTQSIELRDLSYRYPKSADFAVANASLHIAKGDLVALTGDSGAGKSTVADLIMGLLRPQSGRLVVDGEEISDSKVEAWQRQIAHVPQFPFLIDGSIDQNIVLGLSGAVDQARLDSALTMAGLGDLDAFPEGADTIVGEHGVRLSGGQRQRIALARAIYRKAPLLILDEATSALDPESEAGIRAALAELTRMGTTIIIIAHRGDLLEDASRVIRLENGRVVSGSGAIDPGVEHEDCP